MGRPKIYENDAARVAAHRARTHRVDLNLTPELGKTVAEMAAKLDTNQSTLLVSMIKFALANRNWEKLGLAFAKQ